MSAATCPRCGTKTDLPFHTCNATKATEQTNKPGVDVAHQWLKKSREEANGPISQWTSEEMDRYHTDLGLLVDFVTDCWPNEHILTQTAH